MSVRYAVYLAPPPDSELWRFGSRVLGRDAATGERIEGFFPAGFDAETWREIAAEPRHYGFHATLKAPMRLENGFEVEDFEAEIDKLAAAIDAFELGPLRVAALKFGGGETGFVALVAKTPPLELAALEAHILRGLDPFRASPGDAEIARRRPDRLTPRQREHLFAWGYPYVLDEFRLHFTLSGSVPAPEDLAERLAVDFAREVSDPRFTVDALALFEQHDGGDFRLRRRFALRPPRPTGT